MGNNSHFPAFLHSCFENTHTAIPNLHENVNIYCIPAKSGLTPAEISVRICQTAQHALSLPVHRSYVTLGLDQTELFVNNKKVLLWILAKELHVLLVNKQKLCILRIRILVLYAGIKMQQALVLLRCENSHRYKNIFHCVESSEETVKKKASSASE